MSVNAKAQHIITRLAAFPEARLRRCGATNAQIATMQANWLTHTDDWQAEETHYINSVTDFDVAGYLAAWPPAPPASFINQWPFQ